METHATRVLAQINAQGSVIATNSEPCVMEDSDEEPARCTQYADIVCTPAEKWTGKCIAKYMRYKIFIFRTLTCDLRPAIKTGGKVRICGFWLKINLPELTLGEKEPE